MFTYDRNGNRVKVEEKYHPRMMIPRTRENFINSRPVWQKILSIAIVVIVVGMLSYVGYRVWRKRQNKPRNPVDSSDSNDRL